SRERRGRRSEIATISLDQALVFRLRRIRAHEGDTTIEQGPWPPNRLYALDGKAELRAVGHDARRHPAVGRGSCETSAFRDRPKLLAVECHRFAIAAPGAVDDGAGGGQHGPAIVIAVGRQSNRGFGARRPGPDLCGSAAVITTKIGKPAGGKCETAISQIRGV